MFMIFAVFYPIFPKTYAMIMSYFRYLYMGIRFAHLYQHQPMVVAFSGSQHTNVLP